MRAKRLASIWQTFILLIIVGILAGVVVVILYYPLSVMFGWADIGGEINVWDVYVPILLVFLAPLVFVFLTATGLKGGKK